MEPLSRAIFRLVGLSPRQITGHAPWRTRSDSIACKDTLCSYLDIALAKDMHQNHRSSQSSKYKKKSLFQHLSSIVIATEPGVGTFSSGRDAPDPLGPW
jgi:hypothetical protein